MEQNSEKMKEQAAEKEAVALSSVLAAIALTVVKIIVGFLTGSLGIISEAAHSLFDLIAALVTFFAVRAADKPPDPDHHYGHGKVESISAMVETLLLLATCGWIIHESIERLFFKNVPVTVNVWGYGVLVLSIIVNYSRARALYRTARRYNSQALEADALHFSSDILSSLVVIIGLALVSLGFPTADPISALLVAFIIIYACFELGKKALETLLDTAPRGLAGRIEEITRGTEGILDAQSVRIRQSGSRTFVDMKVTMPRTVSFEKAHTVTEEVESKVLSLIPDADVVIHTEPIEVDTEGLRDKIRMVATSMNLHVHDIRIQTIGKSVSAELHLELDSNLPLWKAHSTATHMEREIIKRLPAITEVTTHIEAAQSEEPDGSEPEAGVDSAKQRIRKMALRVNGVQDCHAVSIKRSDRGLFITLHCLLDDDLPLHRVHEISTELERHILSRFPGADKVHVHAEPLNDAGGQRQSH
jgi:cation diffusion facilitator family transporter